MGDMSFRNIALVCIISEIAKEAHNANEINREEWAVSEIYNPMGDRCCSCKEHSVDDMWNWILQIIKRMKIIITECCTKCSEGSGPGRTKYFNNSRAHR